MVIKKTNIGNIDIDNEYSIRGNTFTISINDNSEVISCKSLSDIRLLANLDKIKTVTEYYDGFFKSINCLGSIDYTILLGKKKSKKYLLYLKDRINKTIPMLTTYHTQIFPKRLECYNNLVQVKLKNNILSIPKYTHSGVTGRTSIKEGYNFLTMKKDERKKIKPLDSNYDLYEVDFKSCEPFFFLKSVGKSIDSRDVYTWLKNKYNIKLDDRDKIKRGILSMIYGANVATTSRIMKISRDKISNMKDDMGITLLSDRLEKEYEEHGFIRNYYGRPITSNNNLVNYWIQSSTVDFCSLAFLEFYKNNNIQPCFFIHDSMTFQVKKEKIKKILSIDSLVDSLSGIDIPVEFIKIT
eukprot:GHVU01218013.1.p1 GENE.GHVU01218013.1~~GHVU01218013.1.p1  ORF type:complete len:354 (-),score=27.86 GHVU01218013.1:31-1092(-)